MTHLYYRLARVDDPEENVEDALMHKALSDEFGKGLTMVERDSPAPSDGLFLGRGRRSEMNRNLLGQVNPIYWEDQAFRSSISRSFLVTNLDGAEAEVARLHGEGKDAFLKSTQQKQMVCKAPRGETLHQALGDWVWSFIDRDDCLMVQEYVEMSYERRFLIMNGEVVTQSPVAWHLTPMSRSWIKDETGFDLEDLHYRKPSEHTARYSRKATERLTAFAQAIANESSFDHFCLDLAILGEDPENDPIEAIEYNPMQPGAVGLFGCCPRRIAKAVREALSPEIRTAVEARQAGRMISDLSAEEAELNKRPEEEAIDFDDAFEGEFLDEIEVEP